MAAPRRGPVERSRRLRQRPPWPVASRQSPTRSLVAGDKAHCCPAFGARGAIATAAEASPAADVITTTSGARGETRTISRARDVAAELPPAAGKKLSCSSAPGLVATASGARGGVPRGKSRDDGPRGVLGGRDDLPGARRRHDVASLDRGGRVLLPGVRAACNGVRGLWRDRDGGGGVPRGLCRRHGVHGVWGRHDEVRRRHELIRGDGDGAKCLPRR